MHRLTRAVVALALASAAPAIAQQPAPAAQPSLSTGPADQPPPDLPMPQLDFTPKAEDQADYDKYFYFHRADTSYAQALADIRECDALASGSNINLFNDAAAENVANQYGPMGSLVAPLGAAIADAVFGSAERRKQRRISIRNCMGFKQYQRYGLSHKLWSGFNFEEGNGRKRETERNTDLALQAMIASGPKPVAGELGL